MLMKFRQQVEVYEVNLVFWSTIQQHVLSTFDKHNICGNFGFCTLDPIWQSESKKNWATTGLAMESNRIRNTEYGTQNIVKGIRNTEYGTHNIVKGTLGGQQVAMAHLGRTQKSHVANLFVWVLAWYHMLQTCLSSALWPATYITLLSLSLWSTHDIAYDITCALMI